MFGLFKEVLLLYNNESDRNYSKNEIRPNIKFTLRKSGQVTFDIFNTVNT